VSNVLSYVSVAVGSVPTVSLFMAVPVSEFGSGVEISRVSCQAARDVAVMANVSIVLRMMMLRILCMVVLPPFCFLIHVVLMFLPHGYFV